MSVGKRGALFVFEGCDRSGKTTQSRLLAAFLKSKGIPTLSMNFPERESCIGQVINSYLTNRNDLPDEVIHLMFSANRWEYMNKITMELLAGTTLIVDRYSYSGVAYTVAKGLDFDWCYAPERGLFKPDAVFYLKTAPDNLLSREKYGEERYEKLEFQQKVAEVFNRICKQESSYWHQIDACQPVEEIHTQISGIAEKLQQQVDGQPLNKFT